MYGTAADPGPPEGGPPDPVTAATVDRLRGEVTGLRQAMRSRAVIEQAKGVLMARRGCSADEAFAELAQLSQDTNTKLVDVAADLLGVVAPPAGDRAAAAPGAPAAADPPAPPDLEGSRAARPSAHDRTTGGAEPHAAEPADAPDAFAARYHVAAAAAAAAADADELARLLCRECAAVLGADAVAVAALEPDGGLRLVGTSGVAMARVSEWHRIPPQTSIPLVDAVRTERPVRIRDQADFAARYPHLAAGRLMPGAGLCALPLSGPDGAALGSVAVSFPGTDAVLDDADAMAYLHSLAGLCARALARIGAGAAPGEAGPGGAMWFRAFVDTLLDPMLILVPLRADDGPRAVADFRVEYANSATVDLAGRTAEDLTGGRMSELYPGMVESGVFARLLEVQATGVAYEGLAEQFVELVSGALHSSTMTLRAVRFLDRLLVSWRIHDEDERHAAQLSQARSLGRIGTWHYAVGTGELACSPEVFEIIGLPESAALPTLGQAAELVNAADLDAITTAWDKLLTEHRRQTVEFRIARPDGGVRSVRASAEAAPGPDAESALMVSGVLQDVTAGRRTQDALAAARSALVEERGRTEVQHDAVLTLQQALVRSPESVPADIRFEAHYIPAESAARVGGDWYDVAGLPDGRTLVAIGDVSGHGLPAVAGMMQLRHALRGMAYTGAEPAQILAWLNRMLCHQRADYIATAVCGHLVDGVFTWAQAGHLPPLRVRDGVPDVLTPPSGMVLGAVEEARYASTAVRVAPGDVVLLYTDGLIEHRGDDLGRGLSRLVRTVRDGPADDVRACVAHVMKTLGTPNPQDDTCLIGFQVPSGPG
ncbi:SpoIIE family protein phosphatase [Yinghuangia sp. KLBMP8922]|uniref:SpoIIE family protein phosphatase n=1 Tax=Yinghuangia soli TaxID=2908204 RepID=A0AA41TZH3_9ACTN|nr:SpoIIE family protein phosphatase [Yinghuangia soli]